jgi:hypothetical protein
MKKNVPNYFYFFAEDVQTGLPKTGLTITVSIVKDGSEPPATAGNTVTEIGSGYYKLLGTASECNADNILVIPSTATQNVRIVPVGYETQNVTKELFNEIAADYQTNGTIGHLLASTKNDTTFIIGDTTQLKSDTAVLKSDTSEIKSGIDTVLSGISVIDANISIIIDALSNIPTIGQEVDSIKEIVEAIAYGRYTLDESDPTIATFYRNDGITPFFTVKITKTERVRHA